MPRLLVKNPQMMVLRDLITGDKLYKVPRFQRNYSWDASEWGDLWDDLHAACRSGRDHYMGYIVLQEESPRESKIIDGQQRMVTLSLLILAGINSLAPKSDLRKKMKQRFLQTEDLSSSAFMPQNRLTLNRINDAYYHTLLSGEHPGKDRDAHISNEKMRRALNFFEDKFKKAPGKKTDKDIVHFINNQMGSVVSFTTLFVEDDEAAFRVFETLNARGVGLSSPDLLKNHIFTMAGRKQASEANIFMLDGMWGNIGTNLKSENFTDFLRSFHISRKGVAVPKTALYREVRNDLMEPENVLPFLNDMLAASSVYARMCNPGAKDWESPELRNDLENLNLYRSKQHFALLLAAHKKWGENAEFVKLARYCAVIVFRRSVICGLNPNDLDSAFGKAIAALTKNKVKKAGDLLRYLKSVYPSDLRFLASFSEKAFSASAGKRLGKSILSAIEQRKSGISGNTATLEHILPKNPADNSQDNFDEPKHERLLWSIGNLALLEESLNKKAANKPFEEKRPFYKKSRFATTREGTNCREWEAKDIAARQRKLAKTARTVWKIQFRR